jgi:hypothetical protein
VTLSAGNRRTIYAYADSARSLLNVLGAPESSEKMELRGWAVGWTVAVLMCGLVIPVGTARRAPLRRR